MVRADQRAAGVEKGGGEGMVWFGFLLRRGGERESGGEERRKGEQVQWTFKG